VIDKKQIIPDTGDVVQSFARETSVGAVGDVSEWDDQTILAGMKTECMDICALDSNYPGRYHRLGTFIIESSKRFGRDAVRLMLKADGISRTTAHWAEQISRWYSYEQAVQFVSVRAIVRTLPSKQPRKKNPEVKPMRGDHQIVALQAPRQVPLSPDKEETVLDRFIRLGIEVKELFGNEAIDKAVEQIKAHIVETFDAVYVEV